MDNQPMYTLPTLENAVRSGDIDASFAALYKGHDPEAVRRRYLELLRRHHAELDWDGEASLFSTPGRTEIGGNHTDHQNGCVVSGSVNLDMIAVACPTSRNAIRLHSEGFPPIIVPMDTLAVHPAEANRPEALVRGIASQFAERGFPVSGLDVTAASDVLKGSGLSSSAAFEIMVGAVMNHFFAGGAVSRVDICKIGRYAENVYFGKPCGLEDQIACCTGGVQFVDFKDIDNPEITKLDVDFRDHDLALCIVDSGADHADLTHEYASIPGEMRCVASLFGRDALRQVDEEEFVRDIPRVRRECGDRAVLRALHFFAENRRAREEAQALSTGDVGAFLRLVKESGQSSHMYLQNIFPAGQPRRQDVGLALALCDRLLAGEGAFRVHGGGFAGTVQAFVPLDMLPAFKKGMENVLGEGHCHVLNIREAGGVRIA